MEYRIVASTFFLRLLQQGYTIIKSIQFPETILIIKEIRAGRLINECLVGIGCNDILARAVVLVIGKITIERLSMM